MQAAEQKPRPHAGDPGFLFDADGAEIILSRGFKAGKAEDLLLPHGDIAGAGDGGKGRFAFVHPSLAEMLPHKGQDPAPVRRDDPFDRDAPGLQCLQNGHFIRQAPKLYKQVLCHQKSLLFAAMPAGVTARPPSPVSRTQAGIPQPI